jgi:hypothetical protein
MAPTPSVAQQVSGQRLPVIWLMHKMHGDRTQTYEAEMVKFEGRF